MKKLLSRGLSLLLVLSMVLALVPVLRIETKAWSTNQQNIADRADFFFNTTWVCQKTVAAWRDETYFIEGETYHLPYGQPVNSGKFIGYGVELEDFLIAAADADSVFYSRQSEWMGWTSVYYATDCAAFVAMCWGTVRQDCSTIPYYATNMGHPTVTNIHNILQLGDALDSTTVGHVVLVTDLIYDDSGELVQIEITEQTPPQLKRTYFTPETLAEKYAEEFYIYRYEGSVPAVPEWGYTSECTNYASHCSIEITADETIMSLPCGETIDSTSVSMGTVTAGETYVATRLYENTEGELWYRIDLGNKNVGYIPAEGTRYLDQITTDITLSDAVYPDALVKGKTYSLVGNLSARYNQLVTAYAYVYSGFGVSGSPITGDSDYATSNAYTLKNSNIDYNTSFGTLATGNYTMAVGGTYKNYYVADGAIQENTGTLELDQGYFMVVPSSTNQSSCSHSYTETVIQEGTCTAPGSSVFACSKCGDVYEQVQSAPGHSFGDWTVTLAATCIQEGTETRTCTACSAAETQAIPATGHSHEGQQLEGNCQQYPQTVYTCTACGDSYSVYDEAIYCDWQETYPQDMDPELIEEKTQYRYSDREEILSQEQALEGYELLGEAWEPTDTQTVSYVKQWPTGFSTNSDLYTQYNNQPLTGWETDTEKMTVDSDTVTGYLYYHWCYQDSYYSQSTSSNRYNIFHAYYSTTEPGSYRVDTSDMSYCTAHEGCTNTDWYFVVEINSQTCTTSQKLYRQGRWTQFTPWDDEAVTESDTRKVETRTVYRYPDVALMEHQMQTTIIDATCTEAGSETHTCQLCGYSEQIAIPATGHSYETEVVPPTPEQNGYTVYTCTVCGHSYTGDETTVEHLYDDGVITTEPSCTTEGVKTFTCTLCGDTYTEAIPATGHSHDEGTVTTEPGCTTEGVKTFTCTLCGDTCTEAIPATGHSHDEGTVTTEPGCTTEGVKTFTCTNCGDTYTEAIPATGHSYDEGTVTTEPGCTTEGVKTFTCTLCGDTCTEAIPATGHSYESELIAPTCDQGGYTLYTCPLCGDSYTDSKTEALGHSYEAQVVAPTCTKGGYTVYTCTLCGHSYTGDETPAQHSYQAIVIAPTCDRNGYTLYTCTHCGDSYTAEETTAEHSYQTVVVAPTCSRDGYTLYTCSLCGHSYTGDETTAEHRYQAVTVDATCTAGGKTVHTCTACGNSYTDNETLALGHSYENGICSVCGNEEVTVDVTLTPLYPSLYFEDEISITAYFALSEGANIPLTNMGLVCWSTPQAEGTVDTAEVVTSGAYLHEDGTYSVRTKGIPAKNLADTVYFKIYAKLADGTYLYSKLLSYSPRMYADSTLSNPASGNELKSLVVAMLNYGAAAQTYFSYHPYSLMNQGLSAEDAARAEAYDPSMIAGLVSADPQKLGAFASTGTGFSGRYPSITFDSAFSIDYFFTPSQTVASDVVLYVWNQSDYESADLLTAENATQALVMTGPGSYEAAVTGIVAKDIDRTVFVAARYTDDQGVTHCSGVLNYSLGAYCVSQASLNDPIAPFAQATAVYGYYARRFFEVN